MRCRRDCSSLLHASPTKRNMITAGPLTFLTSSSPLQHIFSCKPAPHEAHTSQEPKQLLEFPADLILTRSPSIPQRRLGRLSKPSEPPQTTPPSSNNSPSQSHPTLCESQPQSYQKPPE